MKAIALVLLLATAMLTTPANAAENIDRCWSDWQEGNVDAAYLCAFLKVGAASDSRTHLLLKTHFAKGRYNRVIRDFDKISNTSPDYKAVNQLAIQAYLNLNRFQEARDLALQSKVVDQYRMTELEELARYPVSYELEDADIIPFKQDDWNPMMPSFDVEVAGQHMTGNMDTGGNYVAMSPKLADQLGIKYVFIGYGNANDQKISIWLGHADFRIGRMMVRNAPVYVLASFGVPGIETRIFFGTSILANFLTTFDYQKQRMILSKKDDRRARQWHLNLLPKTTMKMDFCLWGDHYMFARGAIGKFDKLNFFVDSGLALFKEPEHKQVAFYGSTETMKRLGYSDSDLEEPIFPLNTPLMLGTLNQSGHFAYHSDHFPIPSLGGVEIHGLISHAFLSEYVWTIDFKNRQYLFAQ